MTNKVPIAQTPEATLFAIYPPQDGKRFYVKNKETKWLTDEQMMNWVKTNPVKFALPKLEQMFFKKT